MGSYRVLAPCLVTAALLLASCSPRPSFVAKEEPWRAEDERSCIAAQAVRESPFVVAQAALGGPSVCGALRPYQMTAAMGGRVGLRPAALLRCPMVPAVDHWVTHVVQPAAARHLRVPVGELQVAASYACRPMNNVIGAKLSEHGHANALDVSAFLLADGRKVTVKQGWHGDPHERAFLREIHAGACTIFTTVLGPNADANHHDHFHLDLARHGRDGTLRICK